LCENEKKSLLTLFNTYPLPHPSLSGSSLPPLWVLSTPSLPPAGQKSPPRKPSHDLFRAGAHNKYSPRPLPLKSKKVNIIYSIRRTLPFALATLALWLGAAAQDSPLASGRWWKVTVTQSAMYRIGVSDLPALRDADVARIGLYGGDGLQLSTDNAVTPTDGLRPIAIEVTDANGNGRFDGSDAVIFYGEGCDAWRFDAGDERWELRRHAYASANFYYLTADATAPARIASAPAPSADTIIDTYTAVTAVHNDIVNIFESGQLWMGEKFSAANNRRTFSLSLPATAGDIKFRYALANKSTATGTFSVALGTQRHIHPIGASTVYTTVLEAVPQRAQSLSVDITYTPGESGGEGYLDYIEMTGHVPLTYNGGQLTVRNDQALSRLAATFAASGSSTAAMRVWDVSRAGAERAMVVTDGRWSDSTAGQPRRYALFSNASLLSPAAVASLPNQNLHGAAQADYVVVANPLFRQQADRIAALHASADGLSTLVVSDQQVFNEFSAGKQDPMAIRAFLRHLKQRHGDNAPRYLLLFGKATYDNRDLLGYSLPSVVTYETTHSFDDDGLSYCSDDMMGYLDDNETGGASQQLDLGIGRLPAASLAEAEHMVDKVEGYITRRDLQDEAVRGDWRNYVALLSDDADPSHPGDTAFVHSSEATARRISSLYPHFNIDRLYADAFRQQSGAIGSYYPDLNNALRQRLDYGCLLLNYIGHGSQKYIGTERYIEPSDVAAYTNIDRLPLFVTSTCSYGYHDKPDDRCGAELFLTADGGAVAVVSASRPISHNERFNTDLVVFALDPANTIGDALRKAKNRTAVSPCIGLSGDPALRLAAPRHEVVVTHIDGQPVSDAYDTATVLSRITVSGEIRRADGSLIDDFDGTVYPVVFDRPTPSSTRANDNPGSEVSFVQQKNILYKGAERVSAGRFSYTFVVPRDIAYQYAPAKLSHYAKSGTVDAGGQYGRLLLGGLNEESELCETRPEIRLFLGDTSFRNGGLTDNSPTLVARLWDSVGINAFGSGIGHDITATLDANGGSTVVLNDFYETDIDDPQRGTVRYTFRDLTPGRHTLTLKAWNIWGFSNSATLSFTVRDDGDDILSPLAVYPNPAHGRALLHLETNSPDLISSARIQIFSSQGALVYSADVPPSSGYTVGPVVWDLSDVPPGVYLARILVSTTDGSTLQRTAKCVVR